jgi:hypothetical protein
MQPQQRPTPPPFPPLLLDLPQQASPPTAPCVAVVFKAHRYEDGAPNTWYGAQIAQVTRSHGRVQLLREGDGVVFDVPDEEVERVDTIDKERSLPSVHASAWQPG